MDYSTRATEHRARLDATLKRHLPQEGEAPERLHQAMRYAVFNGGKRLRPLLVAASAEALALEPKDHDLKAAALELVHCYSLVHDDLPAMDDDDLRRGRPTVHKVWDEATAILVGDALLTEAFGMLADAPHGAEAVGLVAQAAGSRGMIGGQLLDLDFEARRPSQSDLEQMYRMKTGGLLRAAVLLPMTGNPRLQARCTVALERYADAIGIAFQIVDDLLDIEGNASLTGKAGGQDAAHSKATWPALFGVQAARERCSALKVDALEAISTLPGDLSGLTWLAERIIDRDH